jgi:hypothetical protein
MKKTFLLIALTALLLSCNQKQHNQAGNMRTAADTTDATNNFYDNTETKLLGEPVIEVAGEISNPGTVDLKKLPLRSVIVKEALLSGDTNRFVGAYRYDGYSLFDIMNSFKLDKKNKKEFNPIIDLYVEIENKKGEKAIFSWGELYYPAKLHQLIIATEVSRIVPTKTKELWPLPQSFKLVNANDLLTERNIDEPVKITVKSFPRSFKTMKGMNPMYAPKLAVWVGNEKKEELTALPREFAQHTYETIFYGRGKGIHSTTPFTGIYLKDLVLKHIKHTPQNLRNGLVAVVGLDGYRTIYTFGELINRNDQQEVILMCDPENKTDGIFKAFPAGDFFSDRAVKAITDIYILEQ